MNKYLMLSAAALAVSGAVTPTGASATRIGFSGFCDGLELSTSDGFIYSMKHLYTGCRGTSSGSGAALVGKSKAFGEAYGLKKWVLWRSTRRTEFGWVCRPVANPVRQSRVCCRSRRDLLFVLHWIRCKERGVELSQTLRLGAEGKGNGPSRDQSGKPIEVHETRRS